MLKAQLALPALADLGPELQRVSEVLTGRLVGRIAAAGGALPFAAFMEAVLYEPGLGYYVRDGAGIGEHGDFITAPEMGPLFARCLAAPCAQVLGSLGGGVVMEPGAGSGAMARDLLLELDRADLLPAEYRIVERSPALVARQKQTLAALPRRLARRVRWLADPEPLHGVVVANELLDAIAVERFVVRGDGVRRLAVGWDGARFEWRETPPDAALATWYAALAAELPEPLPPGYRSEWCRDLGVVLERFTAPLERGVALLLDYGYPRAEYYHPQRLDGTLLCHFAQRAHADPLRLVGLQDVTASVDFTALARAARAAGLDLAGFCSQTWFLLGCGAQALLTRAAPDGASPPLAAAGAARRLLLPGEMGERVQVMALARDHDPVLDAFALRDQRPRLEQRLGVPAS